METSRRVGVIALSYWGGRAGRVDRSGEPVARREMAGTPPRWREASLPTARHGWRGGQTRL